VTFSTPAAQDIFNLRPADLGRPLSDLTNRLIDPDLPGNIAQVLSRLNVVEREVRTTDGVWYLMRLLPYRTADDRIAGVVITFGDISGLREAEGRVTRGEERFRLLIEGATDYAIFTMTQEGIVDSWNSGAARMFGYDADAIIGLPFDVLFTPEDRRAGVPADELAQAAATGRAGDERWHVRRDGSRLYCSGVTTRLGKEGAQGFAKIARDLTSQRSAADHLSQAYAELETRIEQRTASLREEARMHSDAKEHVTMLVRKLVTSQEDLRRRIARDLHDQLGQELTALQLGLERHQQHCTSDTNGDLSHVLELTRNINSEIDFLAWELRPAVLDDLGLGAALPKYLREWSRHYGVTAEFRGAEFQRGDLTTDAEIAFYRIAQEALNNVAKHAHANKVAVVLERRDNQVRLTIDDDGVGFAVDDPAIEQSGIGLSGMRERAELIDASLDIESSSGNGCAIYLTWEVPAANETAEST
jgi:PAS domain S-box-containing protein